MSARVRGGAATYYMLNLSIFVREICIFDHHSPYTIIVVLISSVLVN